MRSLCALLGALVCSEAAALRRPAPFGFRHQYLAGGVNTGRGWSTWNPNGSFVTRYDTESWAAGEIPVFSYFMLLRRSRRAATRRRSTSRTCATRSSCAPTGPARGSSSSVRTGRRRWCSTSSPTRGVFGAGRCSVAGVVVRQQFVRLRDELAPNVVLASHMSGWGTKHDIVYEDPLDAVVRRYAAESAAFYRALHAKFDVAFEDFSDRDAGFYAAQQGNAKTWFTPADFARHLLNAKTFVHLAGVRMVTWRIPLGNTVMRAMDNTWDHYQGNRVQWLLGDGSRTRLSAYVAAGFLGFLFGRGADGATCACDAAGDGVTNPAPIDGNTAASVSADDDGGYFTQLSAAYYRAGAVALP